MAIGLVVVDRTNRLGSGDIDVGELSRRGGTKKKSLVHALFVFPFALTFFLEVGLDLVRCKRNDTPGDSRANLLRFSNLLARVCTVYCFNVTLDYHSTHSATHVNLEDEASSHDST